MEEMYLFKTLIVMEIGNWSIVICVVWICLDVINLIECCGDAAQPSS